MPQPTPTAAAALPPAKKLLHKPPHHGAEHSYALPVDTSGQARRRVTVAPPSVDTTAGDTQQLSSETPSSVAEVSKTSHVSRTTQWRHLKKRQQAAAAGLSPTPAKQRKQYSCRTCGATDHPQYYGPRWCPVASGIPYDVWLAQAKAARAAKLAAKDSTATE